MVKRFTILLFLLTCCAPYYGSAQERPIDYTWEDSIVSSVEDGTVELYNNVFITFGETKLQAGYAKIYLKDHIVEASGYKDTLGNITQLPVFEDDGRTFYLSEIKYNWATEKAKIKGVFTQEGANFLNGDAVKKVDSNILFMEGTGFTTCSHEEPHFQIKTGKSKIVMGERIITGPAHFEFFGIPTPLIIPYGYFPTNIEKPNIAGLLMPSFQNSPTQGLGLVNGGWYFPINDFMNVELRGDIFLRGSWAINATTNYKKRYKYTGNFSYSYRNVKRGLKIYEPFGRYTQTKNFNIRWTHNQDPKAHPSRKFNARIDLQNPNFFRNAANAEDLMNGTMTTTNNTMNSSITYNQKLGRASLTVSGNHSQNNGTQNFTTNLPKASFNVPRFFPLKTNDGKSQWYDKVGMNYSSVAEARIKGNLGTITQDLDSTAGYDFSDVLSEYGQYGVKHTTSLSTNGKLLKYITFNPSANFTERWYFQQYDYAFDSLQNKGAVIDTVSGFKSVRDFGFNASMNTKIYGTFLFSKGPIKAIRHMVTPRASFNYRPDFGNEFWGYYQNFTDTLGNELYYNRYSGFIYGSPGRGSNGSISLNLDNNLEAKISARGDTTGKVNKVKILERFNLSTNYNLASQDGYNWNVLRLTAQSSLFKKKLRLSYQGQFDPYSYNAEGERQPILAWRQDQGFVVHRSSQFSASTSLKSNRQKSREAITLEQGAGSFTKGDIDFYQYDGLVSMRQDWDIRLNYDLRFLTKVEPGDSLSNAPLFINEFAAHSISVSGSYRPTDNWSLNYKTGVDLADRSIAFTNINAVRDLHCWEMKFTWVPFGSTRSYLVGINLKSQQFRQVKAQRRRTAVDF
ncbi:MAG: putative LPS assembly protein LptD [Schleiferiaceae bacterium]